MIHWFFWRILGSLRQCLQILCSRHLLRTRHMCGRHHRTLYFTTLTPLRTWIIKEFTSTVRTECSNRIAHPTLTVHRQFYLLYIRPLSVNNRGLLHCSPSLRCKEEIQHGHLFQRRGKLADESPHSQDQLLGVFPHHHADVKPILSRKSCQSLPCISHGSSRPVQCAFQKTVCSIPSSVHGFARSSFCIAQSRVCSPQRMRDRTSAGQFQSGSWGAHTSRGNVEAKAGRHLGHSKTKACGSSSNTNPCSCCTFAKSHRATGSFQSCLCHVGIVSTVRHFRMQG
mmetsp:Transcript_86973/g.166482  ORF Transcript_86973/g.166482 Transcript_86973/m.166482 type:complete len:283 (-) Transcript_86973:66-914(-)